MCLAIPGKVEQITTDGDLRMGRVNFGGIVKNVCLDYVPEVGVGDYTIVHVGFALSKIDEQSAHETLELFRKMGALEEELASEDEAFARAADRPQSACPDGSCGLTGKDPHARDESAKEIAQRIAREIHQVATRPWKIMEVCGGLASALNEIANASNVGIEIDESSLPVRTEVQSACELLGLDPVYVANEGKAVFFVAE